MPTQVNVAVYGFETRYRQDPADGSNVIGEDWIEYGPPGAADRSKTWARVRDVLDRLQPLEGSQNPAVIAAHAKANIIRPKYEAWKSGQEMPIDGTPLAAFTALNKEQVKAIQMAGVQTVEELATLTDATMNRIPLPDKSSLVRKAKAFIDAKEQNRLSVALLDKDREIDNLRSENEERDAQIKALMEKVNQLAEMAADKDDEKTDDAPRRGRPRKAEAA